ncbi:hypothetical protein AC249_AIPGENE18133, partial [Exaiptasia diaphana]
KDLPELQTTESNGILDVGLRGEVITGEESATENDLIRYSNYISGAGSTFGGTMAGLPQTIKDLTEGAMAGLSYQHDKLAYKLKQGITVDVLRQENADAMIKNNIQPEVELRLERTGMVDIQDEFDRITPKDLVEGLYEQLKHHETDLEQPFDTILDSTSLPSGTGQVINVGNGANVVLAKTRGKTYKLGDQSSGSFIVADKFTGGSDKNTIVEGGSDYKNLNTLVVGVGSGGVVNNHLGPHAVIVTGATLDELHFKCGNTKCIKDSQQNLIIDSWYSSNCKRLLFKKEGKTQIVVNGEDFLTGSYNPPIIISHGTDLKLKLELPLEKDDAVIDFHDFKGFLWIIFKHPNIRDITFWYQPYLAIEAEEPQSKQIDAQVVVNAVKTRFKSGLKFTGAGGDIPNN